MIDPIAVIGIGLETPAGRTVRDFWSGLLAGQSFITPIPNDTENLFGCEVAGYVSGFTTDHLEPKKVSRLARHQQMAISATEKALADAELPEDLDPSRIGVVVGTSAAGIPHLQAETIADGDAWRGRTRSGITRWLNHTAATEISSYFGFTGPSLTITTACSASSDAIALAQLYLADNRVDAMVVCGVDTWIEQYTVAAFAGLGAATKVKSDRAHFAARPFDKGRDGVVPGEGAGSLVLIRLADATSKDSIYCELVGHASTCDAHHPFNPRPDGRGVANAILSCLRDADVNASAVDHIVAHGTGTRLGDIAEANAIRTAFGDSTDRPTVTALKSYIGHTLGASGAIEAAALALSIKHQIVVPIANLDMPDANCQLNFVRRNAQQQTIQIGLKLSMGFGGVNTALLFERTE